MWWTIFTAADLYIGLIALDAMTPSISAEKLGRLRVARKVILALLVVSAIVLALQIARRQGWMH
jgi:cell division protein FtsL